MEILIERQKFYDHCTIGNMYFGLGNDQERFCYTLEDKIQDKKVFGETAISPGRYKLVWDFSEHFNRVMPHILGVPLFDGIRIHSGINDKDTEGCVIIGFYLSANGQEIAHGTTRIAAKTFDEQVKPKFDAGEECWVTVTMPDVQSASELPRS